MRQTSSVSRSNSTGGLPLLAAAMILCLFSRPAQAQFDSDHVRQGLAQIAHVTAAVLKRDGLDAIGIGQFAGPPSFASAAGPGLRQILKEEFGKIGIREQKLNAAIGIQGKYILEEMKDFLGNKIEGESQLKISAELVDRSGAVLTNLNASVAITPFEGAEPQNVPINAGTISVDTFSRPEEIGGLLGATVDLAANMGRDPNSPRRDPILDSFNNPTAVVLGGTAVASSRNSPFTLEVLVDGQPRGITLEQGHPFVELNKGEQFELRVVNRAGYDSAATFTLDGVNSFAFSEVRYTSGPKRGEPKYSKWIVSRGSLFTLKGWHVDNTSVDAFRVTDFADSAAAKFGSTSGIGTITATIRATWQEGEKPPAGEPLAAAYKMEVGIGKGERLTQKVQEDTAKRNYGIVRSIITIRYAKPE